MKYYVSFLTTRARYYYNFKRKLYTTKLTPACYTTDYNAAERVRSMRNAELFILP
jgi:hypothetical protein